MYDLNRVATLQSIGCVSFKLGESRWAVRLEDIARVLPVPSRQDGPLPVPASPPWLLGVIHLDTHIATLFDLAIFLGLAALSPETGLREKGTGEPMLLTVQYREEDIALLVRDVGALCAVAPVELVSPTASKDTPPFLAARYVPLAQPEEALADIEGVLDIKMIVQTGVAVLEREDHFA